MASQSYPTNMASQASDSESSASSTILDVPEIEIEESFGDTKEAQKEGATFSPRLMVTRPVGTPPPLDLTFTSSPSGPPPTTPLPPLPLSNRLSSSPSGPPPSPLTSTTRPQTQTKVCFSLPSPEQSTPTPKPHRWRSTSITRNQTKILGQDLARSPNPSSSPSSNKPSSNKPSYNNNNNAANNNKNQKGLIPRLRRNRTLDPEALKEVTNYAPQQRQPPPANLPPPTRFAPRAGRLLKGADKEAARVHRAELMGTRDPFEKVDTLGEYTYDQNGEVVKLPTEFQETTHTNLLTDAQDHVIVLSLRDMRFRRALRSDIFPHPVPVEPESESSTTPSSTPLSSTNTTAPNIDNDIETIPTIHSHRPPISELPTDIQADASLPPLLVDGRMIIESIPRLSWRMEIVWRSWNGQKGVLHKSKVWIPIWVWGLRNLGPSARGGKNGEGSMVVFIERGESEREKQWARQKKEEEEKTKASGLLK